MDVLESSLDSHIFLDVHPMIVVILLMTNPIELKHVVCVCESCVRSSDNYYGFFL